MRTVQAGPLSGLIAQLLLLAALAGTVGLSAAGWVVGVACAVVMCAVLARGVVRYGCKRFGPADWVTLTRASLAVGVAALTADSFAGATPVATLVTLATVALVLDSVDGWIVRRTGTATALGGQFDGEVDAFLIAVLSVYVASSVGAWVLAIGAMRYAFLVAGWFLPWLQEPLPTRYWAKVVAATQGIVLTIAAADILPLALTQAMLVISLALLAESFGHGIAWLWVRRGASRSRRAAAERSRPAPAAPRRGPVRTAIGVVLTILAVAVVWVALVTPDQLSRLTPGAYARLPLEGILVIALALVVPAPTRRLVACVVGPLFGLLLIVRILDMGFFEAFDRPFDPIADGSSTGIGIETLRDSIGRTEANLVVIGVATLAVGLLVVTTLAVLQLMRVAAGNRRWAFNAVTALGVVWVLSWLFGAQLVSNAPIASTSAAGLVVQEARAVQAGVDDPAVFANQIRADRYRNTPGKELLTGLRGKDVLLVFVESYGKVAVQDSSFSHKVDAVVNKGTQQLQASGFSSRSAFLTSSTFGGLSWLAHSTMQSGTWVNSQRRYDQLVKTQAPHAQPGLQAGRLADRRRRAVERQGLAGGHVLLRLRQALRPPQRRAISARSSRMPRCPTSTSSWRCSASRSRSRTAVRSSRRSTWCRVTRPGIASRR